MRAAQAQPPLRGHNQSQQHLLPKSNSGQYQLPETNTLKINISFLPAVKYYFNVEENEK